MKTIKIFILLILSTFIFKSYSQVLDSTFGTNGMTISAGVAIEFFDFDNQGNIVALGYSSVGCPTIMKTDANGNINTNFGNNGLVILSEHCSNWGKRYGIKVTDENKIVIVFLELWNTYLGDDPPSQNLIMRFNDDGTIDNSFGNNGEMILANDIITVNTENDNFMLIAFLENFYDNNGYHQKTCISKYSYNGEIDSIFGTNGKIYFGPQMNKFFPSSIKILTDNSIMLVGSKEDGIPVEFACCKLNPNGSFATNFANNGILITNINNNTYSKLFKNVLEDNNGNLAITGRLIDPNYTYCTFIYGFNANGAVNSNFGTNGLFYFDTFSVPNKQAVLQVNNKFFIGEDSKISCINNNGTLDSLFNNSGSFIFNNFKINDMKFQSPNKIIVGSGSGAILSRFIIDTTITVSPIYTVSGNITYNGNPLANVLIDTTTTLITAKNTILTDATGFYEINYIQQNRSLTITPILEGYKFDPPSYTFTATSNETVNFNAKDDVTSIDNQQINNITLYPNPVKDNLNFTEETQVEITDIQGRVLLRTTKAVKTVNISNLQAGIYFVKVTLSNQNVEMIKIVKL